MRLLTRGFGVELDEALIARRVRAALKAREGLKEKLGTNGLRVLFGEGDGLPGVIVDAFGEGNAVLSCFSAGLKPFLPAIVKTLQEGGYRYIYEKSVGEVCQKEGMAEFQGWLTEPGTLPMFFTEGNAKFRSAPDQGQKTGFYLDFRVARHRVGELSRGKTLFDAFCYTGAASVQTALGGATEVLAMDSSQSALEEARENARRNGVEGKIRFEKGDSFHALKELKKSGRSFDGILLDPPPLAKSVHDLPAGRTALERLLGQALDILNPGGFLVAATCSHHFSWTLLEGVVILILLSVFIFVIIVIWFVKDHPLFKVSSQYSIETGQFLSQCTTTPCADGLECDGTTFTCRFKTNHVCSNVSDCVTGLICSGLCVTGPTGTLNTYCPCGSGYICTKNVNSALKVCKGLSGANCSINTDCTSNSCLNTSNKQCTSGDSNCVCSGGFPNSYACAKNSDCSSKYCSQGFCQATGTSSGTLGSSCAGDCVDLPIGQSGASCSQNLTCVCQAGIGAPGTCTLSTGGINDPCSSDSYCSSNLICYNLYAQPCTGDDIGCVCMFPYNNPNIPTQRQCIAGMTPGTSTCLNATGLGCNSNLLCYSNSCGGSSVIAVYNFSTPSGPLYTDYLGATTTKIIPGFSGPVGSTGSLVINPHKMFAISNNNIDTVYLVDSNLGFYSINYNTTTNIPSSNWTQLINITSNQGLLIDVGYSGTGTTFVVAFNNNGTYYTYIWDITTNIYTLIGIPSTSSSNIGIQYIDVSPPNDLSSGGDILISYNGTIYIKPANNNYYTIGNIVGGQNSGNLMTGTTGRSQFYYDISASINDISLIGSPSINNVAFVANYTFSNTGCTSCTGTFIFNNILQFSGNIAGIIAPVDPFNNYNQQYRVFDFSIYSPMTNIGNSGTTGILGASTIMLTTTSSGITGVPDINVVAVNYGGVTNMIPYNVDTTSKCAASNRAFYIISKGSCN